MEINSERPVREAVCNPNVRDVGSSDLPPRFPKMMPRGHSHLATFVLEIVATRETGFAIRLVQPEPSDADG